eukprot:TRINITY_DN51212_c0_g1_i1.p1 TRINITY_DN51212_c0_g1~~TRINITY_DN51212_c0_g1_i1.p1  ORF type:complete len:242 (-),score=69.59 TRINITY_DN51212_c0_g1_i1:102-827(-)
MPGELAEGAVRRLLRHHPKVHPDSITAAELKRIGLGRLPILEWEVEQPWGRYLESAPEQQSKDEAAAQEPNNGFSAAPGRVAGADATPFFEVPFDAQQYGNDAIASLPPVQKVPPIQGFAEMPAGGAFALPPSAPAAAGSETARIAALEAEEAALLSELVSVDNRQGALANAVAGGLPQKAPVLSSAHSVAKDLNVDDPDNTSSPPPPASFSKAGPPPPRASGGRPQQRAPRPPRPAGSAR